MKRYVTFDVMFAKLCFAGRLEDAKYLVAKGFVKNDDPIMDTVYIYAVRHEMYPVMNLLIQLKYNFLKWEYPF